MCVQMYVCFCEMAKNRSVIEGVIDIRPIPSRKHHSSLISEFKQQSAVANRDCMTTRAVNIGVNQWWVSIYI